MSIASRFRKWSFRRKARHAIWFHRYMDRVMQVAGYDRRQTKVVWADFIVHPSMRRSVLNQLAQINTIKQKKIHLSKVELQLDALRLEAGRLQGRLWAAEHRPAELPVEFVEGLILAIDNGESIDGLLGDYGVTIGDKTDEVPAV